MRRWKWQRWAAAVLTGAALTATAAADGPGKSGPAARPAAPGGSGTGAKDGSRPDDTMVLQFPGQPERKVKVVKTTRQPDGSVATEVKDTATGETFTLMDAPPGKAADTPKPPAEKLSPWPTDKAGAKPAAAKEPAAPPKGRPRTADPDPDPADGRKSLFGGNNRPNPMPTEQPAENPPQRKPGLFSRIFGGKKSNPTPQPAANTSAMPGPTAPPSASMPPPVRPTPGARPAAPMTGEPPRTMPPRTMPPVTGNPGGVRSEPVAPPAPVVPVPTPMPKTGLPPLPPPTSNPIPTPLPGPGSVPSIPAPLPGPMPTTPALPPAPGGVGVPSIPVPPSGGPTAFVPPNGGAIQVVLPAGYVTPMIAADREIQPHAVKLGTALMPSERMLAARSLADGRHGSSDQVKAILFKAAQTDLCPAVKACCIEQLCKLGYYHPAFIEHLKAACADPAEEVQKAARESLYKMTPRK